MIPPTLKLPFSFDPVKLKVDAAGLGPNEWVAHFNTGVYEGDWDGVALRSRGGVSAKLYPDPMSTAPYADNQVLSRCPYIQEVLRTFHCSFTAARILRLRPGAKIREHRDYNLGFEDGVIRVHIPIQTAPGVAFFLDGKLVAMEEGEAWYLNLYLPHRVQNDSSTDRLHLVLDCVVNDWLTGLFPVSESRPSGVLI